MTEEEKQLIEEAEEKIVGYQDINIPPFFEMYLTMFSILMAMMLFLFPDLFVATNEVYVRLLMILPQDGWALFFFLASMSKAFGLLFHLNRLRIFGLCLSVAIYAVFAVVYLLASPSIGLAVFLTKVIFTILTIPYVKDSGLRR